MSKRCIYPQLPLYEQYIDVSPYLYMSNRCIYPSLPLYEQYKDVSPYLYMSNICIYPQLPLYEQYIDASHYLYMSNRCIYPSNDWFILNTIEVVIVLISWNTVPQVVSGGRQGSKLCNHFIVLNKAIYKQINKISTILSWKSRPRPLQKCMPYECCVSQNMEVERCLEDNPFYALICGIISTCNLQVRKNYHKIPVVLVCLFLLLKK